MLYEVITLSSEEFPHFPQPDDAKMTPINGGILGDMIDKTYFSVSTDETKYNLNGIYFKSETENGKGILRLVATDGHRLAMTFRPVDTTSIVV